MISYRKLNSGAWGLASEEKLEPGQTVAVTKRDGSIKTEMVGAYRGREFDKHIYSIEGQRTAAAMSSESVGDLSGILALFDKAKRKLKFPAIVLGVPAVGMTIRINVAGERARAPGSLTVADAERDEESGRRDWLGRVHLDGRYEARMGLPARETAAIDQRLRDFAADPVKVAGEHGKLTGRCCFCNRPLEDERSTAVGYGPVCAQNFGLEWGSRENAPLKMSKSKGLQQSAQLNLLGAG